MLAALVALVLFVGAAFGGAVYASDGSGPGDTLYGLDKTVENVRFELAGDDDTRAELQLEFASERLDEASEHDGEEGEVEMALQGYDEAIAFLQSKLDEGTLTPELAAAVQEAIAELEAARESAGFGPSPLFEVEVEGDEVEVELEDELEEGDDNGLDDDGHEDEIVGIVESFDGTTIVVNGQAYTVSPDTETEGDLVPGANVKLELVTLSDGTLVVRQIEVEDEEDDDNSGPGSVDDDDGFDDDNSGPGSVDDDDGFDDDNSGSGGGEDDDYSDDDSSGSGGGGENDDDGDDDSGSGGGGDDDDHDDDDGDDDDHDDDDGDDD